MFGTSDLRGGHPIWQEEIRCLGMFHPPRGHTICSGDVPPARGPNLRGRPFATQGDIRFARGTFDVWDIRSARWTSDLAGGHPMFGNVPPTEGTYDLLGGCLPARGLNLRDRIFASQGDIRFARGTFDGWDIRSARVTSDLAGGHPMFGNVPPTKGTYDSLGGRSTR